MLCIYLHEMVGGHDIFVGRQVDPARYDFDIYRKRGLCSIMMIAPSPEDRVISAI